MKTRSGVALLIGFGTLLLLIAILGLGAMRRSNQMYEQMMAAQQAYEEIDKAVRDLPAHLHLAAILVRDYVLDLSPSATAGYREQLAREQQIIESHLARLNSRNLPQKDTVARLQRETQAYVDSLDPILNWTPEEKSAKGYWFIRSSRLPRRQAIVSLAQEIGALNEENLALEQQALARNRESLQSFLKNILAGCLALGVVVAFLSTYRVVKLEARSSAERQRSEEAEREQRRLAMRVVEAQEEERKRLSLELHDAIGQMASAIGMELGHLESIREGPAEQFHTKLAEIRSLNSDVVRAVKDMATQLRPAMLDDLGLGPALRAHAREFSRRHNVAVSVRLDGDLDSVPEPHRTCIYRIVQEALNNCGRHAKASGAIVSVYGGHDLVNLTVQDDGVGFDPGQRSPTGLGLVGIQERVRELNGKVNITSKPGSGTLLEVELPVLESVAG